MARYCVATAAVFCAALAGCDASQMAGGGRGAAATYKPLHSPGYRYEQFAPGTILYDFGHAAASPTLAIAYERWSGYIRRHPEIEDGFSKNYFVAANFELMRVAYLLGRGADGDAILGRFDLSMLDPPK